MATASCGCCCFEMAGKWAKSWFTVCTARRSWDCRGGRRHGDWSRSTVGRSRGRTAESLQAYSRQYCVLSTLPQGTSGTRYESSKFKLIHYPAVSSGNIGKPAERAIYVL